MKVPLTGLSVAGARARPTSPTMSAGILQLEDRLIGVRATDEILLPLRSEGVALGLFTSLAG
jgi:hypothetical protein